MNKFTATTIAGTLMIASLNASANESDQHPIFNKIDFYEFSVTRSSISATLNEDEKARQLAEIKRARELASEGKMRTAEGLLTKVAKVIYAMPQRQAEQSDLAYKDSKRMQLVFDAVNSILPHAQKIAVEKESDIYELAQVKSNFLRAKNALSENDANTAKSIIELTYRQLKQSVADLRSGDRLYLNIPEPDSREGWQDAAKRFQDWRFLNQYLQEEMQSTGTDVQTFEQARAEADSLYKEASDIALKGDWQAAVEKIDLAYRVLEKSWSRSGIDIGV